MWSKEEIWCTGLAVERVCVGGCTEKVNCLLCLFWVRWKYVVGVSNNIHRYLLTHTRCWNFTVIVIVLPSPPLVYDHVELYNLLLFLWTEQVAVQTGKEKESRRVKSELLVRVSVIFLLWYTVVLLCSSSRCTFVLVACLQLLLVFGMCLYAGEWMYMLGEGKGTIIRLIKMYALYGQ